jgi:glycosyltransferase involved in cell wall biosynthesis
MKPWHRRICRAGPVVKDLRTVNSSTDLARSVWRKVTDVADRYERHRYSIKFVDAPSPRPTVYFLTPDYRTPSGGIRVIYRHVDILNEAGIDASVLHRRPGFRCEWFENETNVTDVAATIVSPRDILVVPEIDVAVLESVPSGIRHVIFNQNSHLTWQRTPQAGRFYAPRPGLAAVVCVSEHNRQMLERAFPAAPLQRVHLGIDERIFHPRGQQQRPRRIAYMPRRGREDARQVMAILQERGLPDGWEIVALDNLSHEDVAVELRKARIFLAFTKVEGFGLPPAEAMACGCHVIGNDGFAGREFFRPEFSTTIESGDITGFVDAIEAAIRLEAGEPGRCERLGRAASQFVLSEYSQSRERDDVVALYSNLFEAQHQARLLQA